MQEIILIAKKINLVYHITSEPLTLFTDSPTIYNVYGDKIRKVETTMAISKVRKNEIIAEYATHEGDTGSPEVQIAVLTEDRKSVV